MFPVAFQSLAFPSARIWNLKVRPRHEPNSSFKNSQPGSQSVRSSPDWSYLTPTSLSALMATQSGRESKKKEHFLSSSQSFYAPSASSSQLVAALQELGWANSRGFLSVDVSRWGAKPSPGMALCLVSELLFDSHESTCGSWYMDFN